MRGIHSSVTDIRRRVFTEIARMSYENMDISELSRLPYTIIPGEVESYRSSIFLERAIVAERLRLCMGLPLRPVGEECAVTDGVHKSVVAEKYYDPPLINVIPFACNKCPEKSFHVTNLCQGCLAHPCTEICPRDAVHLVNGKSVIDQEKCIKCGQCANVCPYNAINKMERPCAKACGVNAIENDHLRRATINQEKCVSCGQCIVHCPFGAIADKSQIYQLIQSINKGDEVIAAIAPAFVGQFGTDMTIDKIKPAMKALGFADVVEVAVGADLCAIEEAKDFLREVPAEQPFMGTSCCPAWSVMAKQWFPDFAPYISMTMTPMVLTARLIKTKHLDAKVVFIGPCAAKKLEASRKSVRSHVDFVLTFEEVMGMFEARSVQFAELAESEALPQEATGAGRNFAVSGGVANAVVAAAKRLAPEREIQVQAAQGLLECRQMLMSAKSGKLNGFLLEGMACPGGCVAGPGTLAHPQKSAQAVAAHSKSAFSQNAMDTKYEIALPLLADEEFFE